MLDFLGKWVDVAKFEHDVDVQLSGLFMKTREWSEPGVIIFQRNTFTGHKRALIKSSSVKNTADADVVEAQLGVKVEWPK